MKSNATSIRKAAEHARFNDPSPKPHWPAPIESSSLATLLSSYRERAGTFANVAVPTEITGADVDRWSLAFDQAIDQASMHLYAVYQHLTPKVDLVTRDLAVSPNGKLKNVGAPLDDFDLFYSGGRIYF